MDDLAGVVDRPEDWPVLDRQVKATGRVQDFVEDRVLTPSGEQIVRQWVEHPGAVAVMAMDDQGRLAVVHQYRHPVGYRLVEPPAGILDHAGESGVSAARRELAEEARLAASDWRTLVDIFTSPGGLQESIRIFLARDLSPTERPDGFVVDGEEADMCLYWLPLEHLVELIYRGEVQSPTMVAGTLALALAVEQGRLDQLRPADADWPARRAKEQRDREFN
ncbi:MAG: NUDIX hydrolase [Propionibacteriaceae bacterium]|uniref:NUDIX hydrolase n=1 Tax=Brooklawnia propionicigenes TaxID=3041175 RepID=A0AAN0KEW7_9ACTN|nr:NUDIX hydrolase [Brooklawnia sp. SH051]MCB0883615.1 NUDIX hydrolase [Propionibacteriaceae bacterium]BEH01418.1 NUDIX hydrolase [Brooklawnia sp. SH051]